jgi:fructose/tagatose bisphosphate aldolase
LQQINNKCLTLSVPPLLVLHGASGLSKDVINRAMDMNICKFNVNTDMRDAAITAIRKSITSNTKVSQNC